MKKIKVLVVEDQTVVREGVVAILSFQPDIEVVGEAHDGLEGLQLAQQKKPDVILLDLMMPRMDGLQFLKAIQKTGLEATIIVISAYGTVDIAIEAMKLGAYDYISKPFKPDEIILNLRKAEEREQSGGCIWIRKRGR